MINIYTVDDQVGRNLYGKGIVIHCTLAYLYVRNCKVSTIECQETTLEVDIIYAP